MLDAGGGIGTAEGSASAGIATSTAWGGASCDTAGSTGLATAAICGRLGASDGAGGGAGKMDKGSAGMVPAGRLAGVIAWGERGWNGSCRVADGAAPSEARSAANSASNPVAAADGAGAAKLTGAGGASGCIGSIGSDEAGGMGAAAPKSIAASADPAAGSNGEVKAALATEAMMA